MVSFFTSYQVMRNESDRYLHFFTSVQHRFMLQTVLTAVKLCKNFKNQLVRKAGMNNPFIR